jgi:hypothetical protein
MLSFLSIYFYTILPAYGIFTSTKLSKKHGNVFYYFTFSNKAYLILNNTGNVHMTSRRIHETIVAVEKQ